MILSDKQADSIIKGCLFTEKRGDGSILTHRFSDAQESSHIGVGAFSSRCHTSAGVRLDFVSDTSFVGIAYRYGERTSRRFMSFDLYADGVMEYSKYSDCFWLTESDAFMYTFPEKKRRRITVWFPFSVQILISHIELSDGAEVTPYQGYTGKLLAYGDSITEGYDAHRVSGCYVHALCRHFDWDVINQGIGGHYCNADCLDPQLPYKPDIVTAAYGTNDWGHFKTAEEYRTETARFFDRLANIHSGIPVYVLLPIWRRDSLSRVTPSGKFYEARAEFAAIAASHKGFTVIDTDTFVPHDPFYFDDQNLHPNDAGFAYYTQGLIQAME